MAGSQGWLYMDETIIILKTPAPVKKQPKFGNIWLPKSFIICHLKCLSWILFLTTYLCVSDQLLNNHPLIRVTLQSKMSHWPFPQCFISVSQNKHMELLLRRPKVLEGPSLSLKNWHTSRKKNDGCCGYFRENHVPTVKVKSATLFPPEEKKKKFPMQMVWINATDIYNNSLVRDLICYSSSKCPLGLKKPKENIFKIINKMSFGVGSSHIHIQKHECWVESSKPKATGTRQFLNAFGRDQHMCPSWRASRRASVFLSWHPE